MTPGILPCPSASAGRFALPIAMALIVLGALAARCPAQSADTKPAATEATTTQAATTEPTTTQAVASEPTTTQAATTEPTTTQATTRPTPQPDDPAAPIVLNFKDASLQTVLDYLAEAAGLVIIGNPKVDGRISLMSRRPVSVEAAIELLDTSCTRRATPPFITHVRTRSRSSRSTPSRTSTRWSARPTIRARSNLATASLRWSSRSTPPTRSSSRPTWPR